MSHDDRLIAMHELLSKIDREQATLIERMVAIRDDMGWIEGRLDTLEEKIKPVTWASQTGSVVLWVCSLIGGIGTLLRLSGKL